MTDIVIAHEDYPMRGGAERVADQLAASFDAPIVTGWVAGGDVSDHDPEELLAASPVERLRPLMNRRLFRRLFYFFAWETAHRLREYDVVIQSQAAPMWYVPEDGQTVVSYMHSPPRALFDLFGSQTHAAEWASSFVNPKYIVRRMWLRAARQLYKTRVSELDAVVANSELVARRARKYLGVRDEDLHVVYPPVQTHRFDAQASSEGYYVALSRLFPTKRVGKIVAAFNRLNAEASGREFRLKVAGSGPDRDRLEAIADGADYVDFLGYVSEAEKASLLEGARACVFTPVAEDFGMVPIEAMAAGTPVIGVRDGFTEHQIIDGENGLLVDREPAAIAAAVRRIDRDGVEWSADRLARFAGQFGVDRFEREMAAVVDKAVDRTTITPSFRVPEPREVPSR